LDRDMVLDRGERSVRTFKRPSSAFVPPFIETTDRGENDCAENCHVADDTSSNKVTASAQLIVFHYINSLGASQTL
uniref:Uncharacterized protein n=1 Tax=Anisakis simplex TaxID=6269 RepID=A0A0M3KC86_ANISI